MDNQTIEESTTLLESAIKTRKRAEVQAEQERERDTCKERTLSEKVEHLRELCNLDVRILKPFPVWTADDDYKKILTMRGKS